MRGQLFEIVRFDNPQSEFVNKLDFAFKTPVGNVDLFLQVLRFDVDGFSKQKKCGILLLSERRPCHVRTFYH